MCLGDIVKFIVFAFNCIFVLAGIALIAVGTVFKLNFNELTDAIPEAYNNIGLAPTLTIVVGSIIFLIAFFGCCGAIRSSSCLLTTYAVILLTIFILQIAIGVFAFLEIKDKNDFEKDVNSTIVKIYNKYGQKDTKELIDFMQQELKCCGVEGKDFYPSNNLPIPKSCCEDKDCNKQKDIFQDGCRQSFFDFLYSAIKIIGIVVLCLSAIEVIGAILSLCLANSIRNNDRRGNYY